jgi:hypothetical protein
MTLMRFSSLDADLISKLDNLTEADFGAVDCMLDKFQEFLARELIFSQLLTLKIRKLYNRTTYKSPRVFLNKKI